MKDVARFAVLFGLLFVVSIVGANSAQAQDLALSQSENVADQTATPLADDHGCFTVYYRTCCHEPWCYYGCFDCPCAAGAAARSLYFQGYLVTVR